MATFDYNPITGNLDLVGSGASYINGVVADPTALPVTLGTPPLDSVYLAKAGSGVWLINRKPAGLYCRVANNGNAADWTYLGAFPEVNADGNWELYNSADPTKELKFDLSGLPTATTRTVNAPAGNGQMLVEGQSIGATTRASGAFTTLSATNGTITASAPVLDLAQTWNNAAVNFTAVRINVTNTASQFGGGLSNLLDLQVGGSPAFFVRPSGNANASGFTTFGGGALSLNGQAILVADASNALAQRNGTNAQTFRLYNTFTDASNYERGFIGWSSNTLRIGTEKAGTGSARALEFQTDGATRLTIASTGAITTNNAAFATAGGFSIQSGNNIVLNSDNGALFWNSGPIFAKDANNILGFRNAGNACTARIYNTFTSTTSFERVNFRWASNEFIIDAEAGSGGGTLRGIKIGSATSSLLGFYGATPVTQRAAIADATDAATTQARLNDLLAAMRSLGLIAT